MVKGITGLYSAISPVLCGRIAIRLPGINKTTKQESLGIDEIEWVIRDIGVS